ncbi:MAG TPA: hypothetical protein VFD58_35225 [Blastocatellia bacterium]|nr:hypothetical protein [Blastocatellia bacterium]
MRLSLQNLIHRFNPPAVVRFLFLCLFLLPVPLSPAAHTKARPLAPATVADGQFDAVTIPLTPDLPQFGLLPTKGIGNIQYSVFVPPEARQLEVLFFAQFPRERVLRLCIRYGKPVTFENGKPVADIVDNYFNGFTQLKFGGGIGGSFVGSLQTGTYYIAIFNPTDEVAQYSVEANISDHTYSALSHMESILR